MKYEILVEATLYKLLEIEAEDEDSAIEQADKIVGNSTEFDGYDEVEVLTDTLTEVTNLSREEIAAKRLGISVRAIREALRAVQQLT